MDCRHEKLKEGVGAEKYKSSGQRQFANTLALADARKAGAPGHVHQSALERHKRHESCLQAFRQRLI
jgi:hypothetical protein